MVSVLFCLTNSEVATQLGRFFGDRLGMPGLRERQQSVALTQYTVRIKQRNYFQIPLEHT